MLEGWIKHRPKKAKFQILHLAAHFFACLYFAQTECVDATSQLHADF
jgi:hypothetical protein